MKAKEFFLISFLLITLAGCGSKAPINSAMTLNLDMGKPDYSLFQVMELSGEGECAGTDVDPCMAEAVFNVTQETTANPMKLLEVQSTVKEVRGYNKQMTFKTGEMYTLRYEVLKVNPSDVISWKFAGKE